MHDDDGREFVDVGNYKSRDAVYHTTDCPATPRTPPSGCGASPNHTAFESANTVPATTRNPKPVTPTSIPPRKTGNRQPNDRLR